MLNDYLIQHNFWAAIKTHHCSRPYTSIPHHPPQRHIKRKIILLTYSLLNKKRTHQNPFQENAYFSKKPGTIHSQVTENPVRKKHVMKGRNRNRHPRASRHYKFSGIVKKKTIWPKFHTGIVIHIEFK
jgi:hypothetical protein